MISGRCAAELPPFGSECPSRVSKPVVALCMSSGRPPGQEALLGPEAPWSVWDGPVCALACCEPSCRPSHNGLTELTKQDSVQTTPVKQAVAVSTAAEVVK